MRRCDLGDGTWYPYIVVTKYEEGVYEEFGGVRLGSLYQYIHTRVSWYIIAIPTHENANCRGEKWQKMAFFTWEYTFLGRETVVGVG